MNDEEGSHHGSGELEPDAESYVRRSFLIYAVYALIAAGLAVAAYETAGVVRVVLATLAGLVATVTIWSTIFMAGIAWLVRFIKRSDTLGPRD